MEKLLHGVVIIVTSNVSLRSVLDKTRTRVKRLLVVYKSLFVKVKLGARPHYAGARRSNLKTEVSL